MEENKEETNEYDSSAYEDKGKKYYEELKSYLGLESIEQAKLFDILEIEFSRMGSWGAKILTYLRAILSRNRRYNTYIQKSDQDLFKKILKDSMDILELQLNNNEEDDNIQGKDTLPDKS